MAPNPIHFTDEERETVIEHVLAELCSGRPVSRTLAEDDDMPSERTWWNWYHKADAEDPNGLVHKVTRARHCGIEAKMDQAMAVAEQPMMGEIRVDKTMNIGGEPTEVTEVRHEDMIGHRKLLVETIFKSAQMLKPKTYGPKLDLTTGGEKIGMADAVERGRLRAIEANREREGDAA